MNTLLLCKHGLYISCKILVRTPRECVQSQVRFHAPLHTLSLCREKRTKHLETTVRIPGNYNKIILKINRSLQFKLC